MAMIEKYPAREVPYPAKPVRDACAPATDEDVLNVANVQGNILAGFNKDHQILLFLRITDPKQFREWLKELTPFVATTEEVLAFNRLFKQIRTRRGKTNILQVTWMNIAFSFDGLRKLAPATTEEFRDEAFQQGMASRSKALGDPTSGEGSTEQWLVGGGKDNDADVVLIFAGDDRDDVLSEVARIEASIFSGRTADGRPMRCGVEIVFRQEGATLPEPLTGHEHFGWLDGVSQPGLRGRTSEDPHSVLTLRQNPANAEQGKPGQDLIWPGEFVFGYPGQNPKDLHAPGEDSMRKEGKPVVPEWARDGAYLVFRRLRQDVPGFRGFLRDKAKEHKITPELLGAKLVGRYPSGAPIMITRNLDHETPESHGLGDDDCRNNAFEFGGVGAGDGAEGGERGGVRAHEAAAGVKKGESAAREGKKEKDCRCPAPVEVEPDPVGAVCPFAAHIRKTYPRDDKGTIDPRFNEESTQTHRLLRRGIPFGPPYPLDPPPSFKDSGERGLLFLAYQTSIVEQFEFVQQAWANNPEFKDKSENGELRSGFDLIIGQNGTEPRDFVLPMEDGTRQIVRADKTWVIPTGGGYYFSPSISTLQALSKGTIG
jgi:Dyp-type peroxidase family